MASLSYDIKVSRAWIFLRWLAYRIGGVDTVCGRILIRLSGLFGMMAIRPSQNT
jgi:hypothetical protein